MTRYLRRGNVIYNQDRWAFLEQMVAERCSLNEIHRTLGVDHRQVKRWFPEYVPVKRGSEAHRELTQMGKKMRALEERQW